MGKVREYEEEEDSLEKAVRNAIKYCTGNNILKKFLETHGSEVYNMLLTEWNLDEAIEVAREEAREETREEDWEYFLELLDQGLTIEEIKERLKQEKEIFRIP
jgi:phosphotransacetylase